MEYLLDVAFGIFLLIAGYCFGLAKHSMTADQEISELRNLQVSQMELDLERKKELIRQIDESIKKVIIS